MVSSAFSRKSNKHGLMTISSGRVWRATQAYSFAVFTPPLLLPLAAETQDTKSHLENTLKEYLEQISKFN